jgi:hypothetical protein
VAGVLESILHSRLATTNQSIQKLSAKTNERVDTMLSLQAQLCACNGLPCPRRFILVEADRDGLRPWRNSHEWFQNAKSVKLYLYVVCSHSNELVSDKSRIKLRYTHKDLTRIAPAYNASLYLLQLTTAIVSGADADLDPFKLKQMDEWSRDR